MPMTAKMKMMMHKTNVKLPKAPTVFPMMEMSKLSVGQDFANLNTRNCNLGDLIEFATAVNQLNSKKKKKEDNCCGGWNYQSE